MALIWGSAEKLVPQAFLNHTSYSNPQVDRESGKHNEQARSTRGDRTSDDTAAGGRLSFRAHTEHVEQPALKQEQISQEKDNRRDDRIMTNQSVHR